MGVWPRTTMPANADAMAPSGPGQSPRGPRGARHNVRHITARYGGGPMETGVMSASALRIAQRVQEEARTRGCLRRPTRTITEASQRLAEIQAELRADCRRRLAALEAEVGLTTVSPAPSVAWRWDPLGRAWRVCDWSAGPVVV